MKTSSKNPPEARLTLDRTDRFALDAILRKHGFIIHARPQRGQPSWRLKDTIYTQDAAIDALPYPVRKELYGVGLVCG